MKHNRLRTAVIGSVTAIGAMTLSPEKLSEANAAEPPGNVKSVFQMIDLLALTQAHAEPKSSALSFGDGATAAVTAPLDGSPGDCRAAGGAYLASCLAAAYKKAARAAGNRPDYRDAKKILNDTAKKLEALAKQNRDANAPRKRGKNGRYSAVKAEAVRAVNRTALRIVAEAETKLLRSTGQSAARKVHYQRIAAAVGSTKRILRS